MRNDRSNRFWVLAVMGGALALAQDALQQRLSPNDDDGPGRGVARISLINGEVSVKRGDTEDIVAATINAPLMVSDRLLTGPGSRAEVQFDAANMLRMAGSSEARMTELEWRRYMVQIAAGTVMFRVLRQSDAQVELNTPSIAIRPLKRGEYRVTVREDGTTEVTVRSGELEVFSPRGSERLRAGRTMLARGSQSDPEFQWLNAIERDEFDRWSQDRDRYIERSRSFDNVSSDIYGVEDLDLHGTWTNSAQYGRVWVPRVQAGWAPYRFGRWVYYDWYGWTWVSYDPWGWAPYHYGRWFYDDLFGWGWWPGQRGIRHFWRPAYVSFFGWGNRVSFGFGWGNVGWVPLAPFEPCYGWWGGSRYNGFRNNTLINNTTIVNNINIRNVYRNARFDNAITSVNANDFGRGRIHDGNFVRTRSADLGGAGLVRGGLPVAPDRSQSVRLADRDAVYLGRSGAGEVRAFRTREPVRVDRVSFDDQRRGVEEIARRQVERGNSAGTGGRGGGAAVENGWRRADQGARGSNNIAGGARGMDSRAAEGGRTLESVRGGGGEGRGSVEMRQQQDSGRGWRRFGDSGNGSGVVVDAGNRGGAVPDRGTFERGNWGRENESGGSRMERGNNRSGTSESGWERFGNSGRRGADRVDRGLGSWRQDAVPFGGEPRETFRRGESESSGAGWRGMDRGSYLPRQQRGPEPVRINPPIVRDRGSDDSGGGFSGFGRGNSGRSDSPRMDAPRMEYPRMERSMPRMDSLRGGGGVGMMSDPPGGGGGYRGGGGSMPPSRGDGGGGSRGGDGGGGGARGGGGRGNRE